MVWSASPIRYRLHDKKLPGEPDIVLSKYTTVIFVHGCRSAGLGWRSRGKVCC
ncbi:hypothetical protein [Spirosoma terrae]|uniref:hypothetical protein n=1 Tax=Spirosoma terrae TaxID=1968276 RepID=UPI0021CE4B33|nr:hypothetical protein [Spirosoma terrae]